MSELIIIGYPDEATADQAFDTVLGLNRDMVVTLTGLAVVTVDEKGKFDVKTPQKVTGVSAASGALWGMLLGVLFFVPFIGVAVGGLMGGLFGKLSQNGIDQHFRERVQSLLTPGSSALVVMASKVTEDKFAEAIKQYGGEILKTSLSDAAERELAEDLASA